MTPSFMGLIATMLPGVRPSISFASLPTASTRPFTLLMATIDGSLTTMPLPRAYTQVLAVPRSIARSLENRDNIERRLNKDSLRRARRLVVGRGSVVVGHRSSVIGGSMDRGDEEREVAHMCAAVRTLQRERPTANDQQPMIKYRLERLRPEYRFSRNP